MAGPTLWAVAVISQGLPSNGMTRQCCDGKALAPDFLQYSGLLEGIRNACFREELLKRVQRSGESWPPNRDSQAKEGGHRTPQFLKK